MWMMTCSFQSQSTQTSTASGEPALEMYTPAPKLWRSPLDMNPGFPTPLPHIFVGLQTVEFMTDVSKSINSPSTVFGVGKAHPSSLTDLKKGQYVLWLPRAFLEILSWVVQRTQNKVQKGKFLLPYHCSSQ